MRLIARLTDEELDRDGLQRTYCGRGSPPHRPDLLVKLLIYEHSRGRPQPVQWLKDLHENKPVQWLVFGMKPSQTTLYEFRDRAAPLLQEWNQQVIRTAIREGHTDGSRGALDGTTVAANASRHRLLKLETVEKRLEQLEQEIAKAEAAPSLEPPSLEPPPAMEAASASEPDAPRVETAPEATGVETAPSFLGETLRGKKRQRIQYRRARDVLRERNQANARRRKDKRKKGERIRVAIGDPLAPFGLDKLKTYRPLYNIQTMSDVRTDLVLAYATTRTTTDSGQLVSMIDRTNQVTGRRMNKVLVDAGYPSGAELAQCQERDVTVFAPWNENGFTQAKRAKGKGAAAIAKGEFSFDPSIASYRCPEGKVLRYQGRNTKQKANGDYIPLEIYQADPSDCAACPLKARCVRGRSGARTVRRQEHQELIDALIERMKDPQSKTIYRDRCCTVERRFADLKTHRGLQRFSGCTPERADAQVGLTVLAHNLQTLAKLRNRSKQCQENPGESPS